MGIFERFLTLWVALAIVLGVLLGSNFPNLFQAVADWEIANVNLSRCAYLADDLSDDATDRLVGD